MVSAMKFLIFAVLLATIQAPISQRKHTHEQRPVPSSPSPAQPIDVVSPNQGQQVRITSAPDTSLVPGKPDYAVWVFNTLLVIVGFLQVWLLFGTLRATRANADAARLNAQAVINSERPWLIIFVKRTSSSLSRQSILAKPTEILSYSFVESYRDSPDTLPLRPNYRKEHIPRVKFVAPSSLTPDGTELDMLVHSPPLVTENESTRVGWNRENGEVLVFYFRVVYRNVLSKVADMPNYETRMCFWYSQDMSGPVVGGPDEYNQHI